MMLWNVIQSVHAADIINLPAATDISTVTNTTTVNQNVATFLNRIATLLLAVAIPLAIIGILYAAFTLMQSAGKPDGYAKAKKDIMYVGTGIFLLVGAAVLVHLSYNLFQ